MTSKALRGIPAARLTEANWNGTMRILQQAFIESAVDCFGTEAMSGFPTFTAADLGPITEDKKRGDWPMSQVVRFIIWAATMSSPDIAINSDVRAVARDTCDPAQRQWKAARELLVCQRNKIVENYVVGKTGLKWSAYVCGCRLRK